MIRPLYKAFEPFMEVKNGYGYQGVLMYDDVEDKTQCHHCGKWFDHLGKHINCAHNESARDYKNDFGLTQKTPLCSIRYSAMKRDTMNENIRIKKCAQNKFSMSTIWLHRKRNYKNGNTVLSKKNEHGLCDLQMKARYAIIKTQVGMIPKESEIRKHDLRLWAALIRRFKTLNNARKWLSEETLSPQDWSRIPDIKLISYLRDFRIKYRRLPKTRDFLGGNGYPSNARYWKRFGSWNQALCVAGLK